MELKTLLSTPTFNFEFKGFKIKGERRGKTAAIFSIDSEKYASYNNYIEVKCMISSIKAAIAEAIFYTKYHGISIKGIDKLKEICEIYKDTFGEDMHQFAMQRFIKNENNR